MIYIRNTALGIVIALFQRSKTRFMDRRRQRQQVWEKKVMIRTIAKTFFGLVAVAALSGTAQAAFVPATWTDDYVTDQVVSSGNPAEYFHDITFDGFKPGQDLVTNFVLTIDLYSTSTSKW